LGLIAVLPAAGLGTRMVEITNGAPKELLPVAGRPVLQWVIEECFAAGAERAVVVTSPGKPEIAAFLKRYGDRRVSLAIQPEPVGLADAVVRGLSPGGAALVPMPDCLFPSGSPASALAEAVRMGAYGAVGIHKVPRSDVHQYGVVGFDSTGRVDRLVEKPSPANAPSHWAVAGRFALSADAVNALLELPERFANLVELLAEGLSRGRRIEAIPVVQEAFDCGRPEGYRDAVAALGP